MNSVRIWLAFLVLFPVTRAHAVKIYSCTLDRETSITWQDAGLLAKAGMKAKVSESSGDPITATLVIDGKKVSLKGNQDQGQLKALSEPHFSKKRIWEQS